MRPRITFANVVSVIALFVALGGTAIATHPGGQNTISTADIINGEVKVADVGQGAVATDEIANGQVQTADIGADQVRGSKVLNGDLTGADVANNSLKGADIDESTLSSIGGGGQAGGDLTGSYPNPEIAPEAVGTNEVADESLLGTDVNESTLGQVPSALLGGLGRSSDRFPSECDPEETAFLTCAVTTIDLPAATSVLVIGAVKAQGGGTGQCDITLRGPGIFQVLARSGFDVGTGINAKFVPLIGITPDARFGLNDFAIECNELAGEVTYFDARVAAVALSPN